jgi:predicted enzyme related to lactoylglutathione lyase
MAAAFRPGENIAMKVPTHEFDRTVSFYRDVLGLEVLAGLSDSEASVVFEFGGKRLWIDCVAMLSQAEIWLEVLADDLEQAAHALEVAGCARRDEIEPLPPGFRGFWVASPCNLIHLVASGSG